MKELDLILEGWLARHYASASAAERTLFGQMLEWSDPEINAYLLGTAAPRDAAWAALLGKLTGRQRPPMRSPAPAVAARPAPGRAADRFGHR